MCKRVTRRNVYGGDKGGGKTELAEEKMLASACGYIRVPKDVAVQARESTFLASISFWNCVPALRPTQFRKDCVHINIYVLIEMNPIMHPRV